MRKSNQTIKIAISITAIAIFTNKNLHCQDIPIGDGTYPTGVNITYDDAGRRTSKTLIFDRAKTSNNKYGELYDTEEISKLTPIEDTLESIKINLYPNPTQDCVKIKFEKLHKESNFKIELFNSKGEVLFNKVATENPTTIDLSNLINGFYFLSIYTSKDNTTFTIIKK